MNYSFIVSALWALFLLVWFIFSFSAKRTVKRHAGPWAARVVVIAIVLVVLSMGGGPAFKQALFEPWASAPLELVGVILCALGIAFAIWARVYLGRNWGMPASVKDNPELVTTGPYAYVRHPIYTGMMLAMIGSALTVGLWWIVMFVTAAYYFIMSARREEELMLATFPHTYPAYRARTKMLVPFIY